MVRPLALCCESSLFVLLGLVVFLFVIMSVCFVFLFFAGFVYCWLFLCLYLRLFPGCLWRFHIVQIESQDASHWKQRKLAIVMLSKSFGHTCLAGRSELGMCDAVTILALPITAWLFACLFAHCDAFQIRLCSLAVCLFVGVMQKCLVGFSEKVPRSCKRGLAGS